MLECRPLGNAGLRYMQEYLSDGIPLARECSGALNAPGEAFTFLPVESPKDVVELMYSARALHPAHARSSVEDWAAAWRDPAYPLSPSGVSPLIELVESAMADRGMTLRCDSDVGRASELHAPVTRKLIVEALSDAYVMATFVAVVSDERNRITLLAIEAYDGEGFVAWKPSV